MKSVCIQIVNSKLWFLLLNTFDITKIPPLRSFLELCNVIIIPRLIAFWTETSNTILALFMALLASLKFFRRMMNGGMTASRSYNKIFWSIIVSYSIYMVNYFSRLKITTKFFLHNKPASFNIWSFGFMRMTRCIYKNIASFFYNTTLPKWTIFASLKRVRLPFKPVSFNITFTIPRHKSFLTTTTNTFSDNFSWFSNWFIMFCKLPKPVFLLKYHMNNILLQKGVYVKH